MINDQDVLRKNIFKIKLNSVKTAHEWCYLLNTGPHPYTHAHTTAGSPLTLISTNNALSWWTMTWRLSGVKLTSTSSRPEIRSFNPHPDYSTTTHLCLYERWAPQKGTAACWTHDMCCSPVLLATHTNTERTTCPQLITINNLCWHNTHIHHTHAQMSCDMGVHHVTNRECYLRMVAGSAIEKVELSVRAAPPVAMVTARHVSW